MCSRLTLPMELWVERRAGALRFAIDGQTGRLEDGEWSDWYQLYANQFARIVRGRSPAQLWLPPAGGGAPG